MYNTVEFSIFIYFHFVLIRACSFKYGWTMGKITESVCTLQFGLHECVGLCYIDIGMYNNIIILVIIFWYIGIILFGIRLDFSCVCVTLT